MLTFVTLAVATPEPLVMLQICVGLVGWCQHRDVIVAILKVNGVWNVNWTVPVPVTVNYLHRYSVAPIPRHSDR